MTSRERKSLVVVALVVAVGALVALAGSQNGAEVGGIPVFALAAAAAFVIQWIVYIPSYLNRTERFFDLTGSLTYIVVTIGVLVLSGATDARAWILAAMVVVWAVRLGSFLFRRVSRAGSDDRFDDLKASWPRFLVTWTLQGLWVMLTAAAAWVAIAAESRPALDWLAWVGVALWVVGLTIEVVADNQKSRFKADPANEGRFIRTGLWSRSRHPNYFGEIVLWVGVAVVAAPAFVGWQWVAIISPVFVTLLLVRVSGIPMLEKKADKRWGGEPEYEEYKRTTPVLVPRP
ncbi:Steroid 5-alpha reductase family enzyme [Paraoerskovia marina]|uniref:Steroid 5-alpha reductase family enzyme n=1 Tax=Paraoerskovia marina TaxID=545619 RepID=A0A1H1N2H5_9CELL|nr:DUF1295 domain-containing protein [Paraoerskovia marina]SDR92389.1 Steroid 5-alpha reductase family enzyme [Paraoerskovia marina]